MAAFLDNGIADMIDPNFGTLTANGKRVGRKVSKITLKGDVKRAVRIVDEQDAVNRYKWFNLPCELTSEDLERMLYYKGQLAFFYNKELDGFFFLPYTLNAKDNVGLDLYGRYSYIKPVPYCTDARKDEKPKTPIEKYFSELSLKCVYAPKLGVDIKDLFNSAVILQDYTPQANVNTITPRATINDSICDAISDCVPFMRTSLLLSTGITGLRVGNGDQLDSVEDANMSVEGAALSGDAWIPIDGSVEFQELTKGAPQKASEYMLAMQSLDNFRLSLLGITSGGVFEKKAHMLETEAEKLGGAVNLVLQDGLKKRQNFCNIVNSIWGIGIWCDLSETITNTDMNGDGVLYDENQGENSGVDTNGGTNNGELE